MKKSLTAADAADAADAEERIRRRAQGEPSRSFE
jgi:hypothetical protein